MTIKEAMRQRHTVRKFTDRPIPAELTELLNERIETNNRNYGLELALVTGSDDGLGVLAKLMGKNVNNYIILAGRDGEGLDERIGYCGADLMLYAQTLGLNTWWIGGMFNMKNAVKRLNSGKLCVEGVIAVGYGATQGVQHKSKKAEEISSYSGVAPQWFKDGVEALLLAPTAMNRQAYRISGRDNQVSLTYNGGRFAGVDLGIGRYHFELGAGKENFEWKDEM